MDSATRDTLARAKPVVPLYIGLATGFCRSFMSFSSSWQRDALLALSNDFGPSFCHERISSIPPSQTPRIEGYSFEAVAAVLLYTTVLSCVA